MGDARLTKRFERAVQAVEVIEDPLARLEAARQHREQLERVERKAVAAARAAGATWRDIGALYGLSKQGAQQRFRPLIKSATRDEDGTTGTAEG